jgi:hypothetical protein
MENWGAVQKQEMKVIENKSLKRTLGNRKRSDRTLGSRPDSSQSGS